MCFFRIALKIELVWYNLCTMPWRKTSTRRGSTCITTREAKMLLRRFERELYAAVTWCILLLQRFSHRDGAGTASRLPIRTCFRRAFYILGRNCAISNFLYSSCPKIMRSCRDQHGDLSFNAGGSIPRDEWTVGQWTGRLKKSWILLGKKKSVETLWRSKFRMIHISNPYLKKEKNLLLRVMCADPPPIPY